MPIGASLMSFSASSVHTAAKMAFVDGIVGMMFFVTPCVSWYVTPCSKPQGSKLSEQAWYLAKAASTPRKRVFMSATMLYTSRYLAVAEAAGMLKTLECLSCSSYASTSPYTHHMCPPHLNIGHDEWPKCRKPHLDAEMLSVRQSPLVHPAYVLLHIGVNGLRLPAAPPRQ